MEVKTVTVVNVIVENTRQTPVQLTYSKHWDRPHCKASQCKV